MPRRPTGRWAGSGPAGPPRAGPVLRGAQERDTSAAVLDHRQDVDLGAAEQVGAEGVYRQDRLRLGSQELRPPRAVPARSRADPGVVENLMPPARSCRRPQKWFRSATLSGRGCNGAALVQGAVRPPVSAPTASGPRSPRREPEASEHRGHAVTVVRSVSARRRSASATAPPRAAHGGGGASVACATAASATLRASTRPVSVGFTEPTVTNSD